MTTVTLNFTQRFKLVDLLAQQEGPLGRTAPFLRVLNTVRFTDAENKEIVVRPVPNDPGKIKFAPPSAEFGAITVDLETADAKALAELLNTWPKFVTADHQWADSIIEQLEKK
jgi:hypothetical protein